ncbi:MAG: ATP-binding protein [Phycisphaerae bacterium]
MKETHSHRHPAVKRNCASQSPKLWCSCDIESDIRKARDVEEAILSQCQMHAFTDRDLFALKLAVEEAINNAIRHGNRCDTSKQIHIKYRVTPRRCDVVIADEGDGFNPAGVPDPTSEHNLEQTSGRGLLLMRAFMNSVVFNESGNAVTLTKFNDSIRQPSRHRVAFG